MFSSLHAAYVVTRLKSSLLLQAKLVQCRSPTPKQPSPNAARTPPYKCFVTANFELLFLVGFPTLSGKPRIHPWKSRGAAGIQRRSLFPDRNAPSTTAAAAAAAAVALPALGSTVGAEWLKADPRRRHRANHNVGDPKSDEEKNIRPRTPRLI